MLVKGILVFLEKRKTRVFVGTLIKHAHQFIFTYDDRYIRMKNIIPLGPELPLTQKRYTSSHLFPSFEDRLPSKDNPAYPEYCQAMGIDAQEKDPFILLSTIGHRGPSHFVFSPLYEEIFGVENVIQYRNLLNLTTREFGELFEIPQASLNALERGRSSGKDLLKRLELIVKFPDVALYLLEVNGGYLVSDKYEYVKKLLNSLN